MSTRSLILDAEGGGEGDVDMSRCYSPNQGLIARSRTSWGGVTGGYADEVPFRSRGTTL